jgi:ABC-type sugar transport system substrate-binding protein
MRWIYTSVLLPLAALCQYESAFASDKRITIVLPDPNSVYNERLLSGAQQASRDLEVDLKQTIIAPTADQNIQSSFLKDLIADKPTGIIIAPSVYPGVGNVLERIFDFQSVIGIGPVKQEEGQLPTVMSNNFKIGTLAADALGQWADESEVT